MADSCRRCKAPLPEGAKFCPECGIKQAKPTRRPKQRGNGTGTVYRLPNGTWKAEVVRKYETVDDRKRLKRRATKSGFATKKAALDYLPTLRGLAKPISAPTITLKAQWEQYEASRRYTDLSTSKQTAYKIAYNRLKNLWDRQMDDLRLADLQTVLDGIKTYYPARDVKQVLSILFQLSIIDQRATTNYAEYLTLPPMPKPQKDAFTVEEQEALWADFKAGNKFTGYILLMIHTGMGLGELQHTQKANIDLIAREITGAGTKTDLRTEQPIRYDAKLDAVIDALLEYSLPSSEKLLSMNEDNFYVQYYATLERAKCRRLTPYCCRHTTATRLAEAGVAPAVIKQVMRHTNYKTTLQYTHVDGAPVVAALGKL